VEDLVGDSDVIDYESETEADDHDSESEDEMGRTDEEDVEFVGEIFRFLFIGTYGETL